MNEMLSREPAEWLINCSDRGLQFKVQEEGLVKREEQSWNNHDRYK